MSRIPFLLLVAFHLVSCSHIARAEVSNALSFGTFTSDERHSPNLLTAPHGGFDLGTEVLTRDTARNLGWDSVIAVGFRQRSHPINVNRPTEGIGLAAAVEAHTDGAKLVYDAFHEKVFKDFEHGGPEFYVEIHGEGRAELQGTIEIATVGVSPEQAGKIAAIFRAELKALALPTNYRVAIEGQDKIFFMASASKKIGILSEVHRALHIELPRKLRTEDPSSTIQLLTHALPRIADLLESPHLDASH